MTAPTQFELQIHQRLLDGDPVASSDLAEAYLPMLIERLRRRWPWLRDETRLYDAAADVLLAYAQHPARYDPAKASLLAYLTLAAHRDLQNALERDGRRGQSTVSLEDVVEGALNRNVAVSGSSNDPADVIVETLAAAELACWIREILPNALDRQLFQLMVEGERQTAAYSAVLGIEGLDVAEQRRIVKQHKDRITKRLQRRGEWLRE